ncbi:hypothetical protein C8R43DRAFT_1232538 [Mycena crocata]|nr:hypothetical protein C8R43DRAFT_1232538 [Mycena crocata]
MERTPPHGARCTLSPTANRRHLQVLGARGNPLVSTLVAAAPPPPNGATSHKSLEGSLHVFAGLLSLAPTHCLPSFLPPPSSLLCLKFPLPVVSSYPLQLHILFKFTSVRAAPRKVADGYWTVTRELILAVGTLARMECNLCRLGWAGLGDTGDFSRALAVSLQGWMNAPLVCCAPTTCWGGRCGPHKPDFSLSNESSLQDFMIGTACTLQVHGTACTLQVHGTACTLQVRADRSLAAG